MVYERSKEKGIRDEKQRHNDNDDKHNEVFKFSRHLAIGFSTIASIGGRIMNNSVRGSLEYSPSQSCSSGWF